MSAADVLARYRADEAEWANLRDELGDAEPSDNEYAAHDDLVAEHAAALAAALAETLAALAAAETAPVQSGGTPELIVLVDDDGETTGLRCPHCSHEHLADEDGPTVVDVSYRWSSSVLDAEDRQVQCSYDGDGDYETDHYQCAGCMGHVELPDGWEESALLGF